MLHKMNAEEMPAEFGVMHFDRWTNSYRDNFNDIFVGRRHGRKTWTMSERQAGNRTFTHSTHSTHRSLERALTAANALYGARHSKAAA